MPQVHLPQLNRSLNVSSENSLMKELLLAGIPVASSCNGDGVCGKCRVTVSTPQTLSKKSELEDFLISKYQLKADQRIACQVFVLSETEVRTTYW